MSKYYEASTFTNPMETAKAARARSITFLFNGKCFHSIETQLAAQEDLTLEIVCWRCRCFVSVRGGRLVLSHKTTIKGQLLGT